MRQIVLIVTMALLGLSTTVVVAEEITACDLEAGHPSDPDLVGPGKPTREVVTHIAIPACRAAVKSDPGVARFHYQLGRAIFYWAGANDADSSEGIEHLQHAADMGHTQALFVLGYIYRLQGKVCESEAPTKQSADQGRKAARLAYVNLVTAGDFDDCTISASKSEMEAYLQDAREQVTGFFEPMLVDSLERQLNEYDED